jgi:hypothetical protein
MLLASTSWRRCVNAATSCNTGSDEFSNKRATISASQFGAWRALPAPTFTDVADNPRFCHFNPEYFEKIFQSAGSNASNAGND